MARHGSWNYFYQYEVSAETLWLRLYISIVYFVNILPPFKNHADKPCFKPLLLNFVFFFRPFSSTWMDFLLAMSPLPSTGWAGAINNSQAKTKMVTLVTLDPMARFILGLICLGRQQKSNFELVWNPVPIQVKLKHKGNCYLARMWNFTTWNVHQGGINFTRPKSLYERPFLHYFILCFLEQALCTREDLLRSKRFLILNGTVYK